MIQIIIKSFVTGIGILVAALILNFIAGSLNIDTWYDFVKDSSKTSIISYLWLFVIYPFSLGLVAYTILKLLK